MNFIIVVIITSLTLIIYFKDYRRIKSKIFEEYVLSHNFRLYRYMPTFDKLIYSFKPFNIKYWFDKELIERYSKKYKPYD